MLEFGEHNAQFQVLSSILISGFACFLAEENFAFGELKMHIVF